MDQFTESLAELEDDLRGGWVALDRRGGEADFTGQTRRMIRELALVFWTKNPLVYRSEQTETNYVFGRGVSVSSDRPEIQAVVESFWYDPDNLAEITSHMAQRQKNLETKISGNVFLALLVDQRTGRVKIRSFPDSEITDIVYDPDDRRVPLLYKREYTTSRFDFTAGTYSSGEIKTEYLVDWKADLGRVRAIGATGVRTDVRVYHVKVNCTQDAKFGVPEIYRAMDWAKAYNEFLSDWKAVVKALARFAFKNKGKSQTALNTSSAALSEKPVRAGSILNEGPGSDLTPMPKGGPSVGVEDGRRLLLMVSAATGVFEHYFGDPSTGNLATSTSMELPMLKMFEARQQLWWEVYTDLLDFALEQAIRAPGGALRGAGYRVQADHRTGEEAIVSRNAEGAKVKTQLWAVRAFRERQRAAMAEARERGLLTGTAMREAVRVVSSKTGGTVPWDYSVDFPPIIQADVASYTTALGGAKTVGVPERELVRLACSVLGIDDMNAVMIEYEKERAERKAMAEKVIASGPQEDGDPVQESFSESLDRLVTALKGVAGDVHSLSGRSD